MDTENMIDITGIDLKKVVKAAYDLSRPQGMGFIHYEEGGLTDTEAESLIDVESKCPVSLDYVKGRACKFNVFRKGGKNYIAKYWYDHTEQDLENLLDRITK